MRVRVTCVIFNTTIPKCRAPYTCPKQDVEYYAILGENLYKFVSLVVTLTFGFQVRRSPTIQSTTSGRWSSGEAAGGHVLGHSSPDTLAPPHAGPTGGTTGVGMAVYSFGADFCKFWVCGLRIWFRFSPMDSQIWISAKLRVWSRF
jgi:hypothetical protein